MTKLDAIIQDLCKTEQADGSYQWDITKPIFAYIPWTVSLLSYTIMGIYGGFHEMHAASLLKQSFELGDYLMRYAGGFGAMFSLGAIGVMFHTKAVN